MFIAMVTTTAQESQPPVHVLWCCVDFLARKGERDGEWGERDRRKKDVVVKGEG